MVNVMGQSISCSICLNSSHKVVSCPVFHTWSHNERCDYVKKRRMCSQCLQLDHRRNDCSAPKCQFCEKSHHSLLHNPKKFEFNNTATITERSNSENHFRALDGQIGKVESKLHNYTLMHISENSDHVSSSSGIYGKEYPRRCFLLIVKSTLIRISSKIQVQATTILDSGGELNIMNSTLCKKLRLIGLPVLIDIVGVGSEVFKKQSKCVNVLIEDRMGYQTPIECIVLDKTFGMALKVDSSILSTFWENLPFPPNNIFMEDGERELLLGMASPNLHLQISLYGLRNGLNIIETRFGPSLVGPALQHLKGNYECSIYNLNKVSFVNEDYEWWNIYDAEIAGITKDCPCQIKTDEEVSFDKCMEGAVTTDADGRFKVKLPWKIDPTNLTNNCSQVICRSVHLERRLSKNHTLRQLFDDHMEEIIS